MKTGIELIAKEIERQVKEEGYRPENDKNHTKGQIAIAAACYALAPFKLFSVRKGYSAPMEWPWSPESWKPTPNNRVKELTKAGVLIVAEIDRILELDNQPAYKTGNRFRFIDGDFGEDYILSQVGPNTVCLISLRSGNRYHDPTEVEDVLKITHQEFKDISADNWMLFEPIGQ